MKMFTSCSDNYKPVFDKFQESVVGSGFNVDDLHVHEYKMPDGPTGFKTKNWYFALLTKMTFFRDELAKLGADEIALFLDCDIQLFKNAPDVIQHLQGVMLQKELTFMFMREGDRDEVNGGLFFARNNRFSRLLLNVVCKELAVDPPPEYGEQTIFNRILKTASFRWDYVPKQNVIWARDYHNSLHQVAFHHAVCAHDTEEKLVQMDEVSRRVDEFVSMRVQPGSGTGSTSAHQIVLCRCNETFPGDFNPEWVGENTVIYNKGHDMTGAPCPVISLVNTGREAHAFLSHIVENFDSLAGVTVFAQARISDSHHLPLHKYLETDSFCALIGSVGQGFHMVDRWSQDDEVGYGYVNNPSVLLKLQTRSMKPTDISMGEFYDRYLRQPRPELGRCITVFNGTFSVTREVIHRKPIEFYQKLLEPLSDHVDPEVAHYYERLWYHIFMGPTVPEWATKPASGYYSLTDVPERCCPES